MRVHFSAAMPCALRIGGAAAGMCGEAEKFADLPCGEELLVEFLPADGDYFPLSFIMSADFFARPPQGVEAYLYDCGADVRAARFAPRSPALRVLAQARAAGMLLTAFDWGGPRLCAEGRGFACLDLPSADVDLGEEHIGGEVFARALCRGGRADRLLLLAPDATAAFDGDADAYACGAELRVEARLFDLCGHTLERTFRARGGRLIESGRALRARPLPNPLDERLLPFALFETLLHGGDASPLLSPALAGQAEALRRYLGGYTAVRPPKEIFYRAHGEIDAAELVYPRAENAFDVRFFRVESEGGKVTNVLPVE